MNSNEITRLKDFTWYFFQLSPNAFFIENEFYKDLSENLKVKLVKDFMTNPKENDMSMLLN